MSDERSAARPSARAPTASPGDIVAGRFRIESELGHGGMARVFRVTDIATSKPFALKLLRAEIANDEEAIARLRREGELLDKLDNPAIVGIETYGKLEDGRLFLVMELLEGVTLGERIRQAKRLDPEELTPIVTGVVAGLHAAHQAGVVHRDLKPDNIFLTRAKTARGMETQVKILDFGISKAVGFERLTRTGQVLGTPRYMAPEQLAADHDLDARVDVYALGVILYEALAGQPPFVAVSPSELIVAILHGKITPLRVYRPDLGDAALTVVGRAMARAREARYGSARELAEAWVDAAVPVQRQKASGPERGLRTRALGGAGPSGAVGADADAASLRLGTFSALEARADVPATQASSIHPQPSRSEVETHHARPRREGAPPAPEPMVTEAPSPYGGSSGTLPGLPLANRRLWWLVVALLAGGLTALTILGAAGFLGGDAEPSESIEAPPNDRQPSPTDDPSSDGDP